jgi:hypothetical protein
MGRAAIGKKMGERTPYMNDDSLMIAIPVPWSTEPIRLHARGLAAIGAGAVIACLSLVVILAMHHG